MNPEEIVQFETMEFHPDDFERYLPTIKSDGTLKERAQDLLVRGTNTIKSLHEKEYNVDHLLGLNSRLIDRLVCFLFDECEKEVLASVHYTGPRATLIAQGGYGRHEMNFFSDVDLLFIHSKKKGAYIEALTEKILYILWDVGLEVGYATRTVPECIKLLGEDITVSTALLDIRYLAGSHEGYESLKKEHRKALSSRLLQKKLIRKKMDERQVRIQKYGGSVFVLEPNVKESAGGLRDLQTPLWVGKILGMPGTYESFLESGLLDQESYHSLIVARNFMWRLRNELHFLSGKKSDLLTFHHQEQVASKMGFTDDEDGILGVERFMQNYYQLAYQVATITDTLLRQITHKERGLAGFIKRLRTKSLDDDFRIVEGQIAVKNARVFKENPLSMMRAFAYVQHLGLDLAPDTKDHLRLCAQLVNDDYRTAPEIIDLFLQMMRNYKNLGKALFAMHDVHFLDQWIPEFRKLRCRVQHDVYHFYTIDTHSIFAVNELSKLAAGDYKGKFDLYADVLAQVAQPELLTLGLFFHDVGKGEGGNHSVKGAKIVGPVTRRLGFSKEEQEIVDFLIQSHLAMPHLSQRRDLEDQQLIIQFARSMGTMDRLNMLFLLTWGDIRAVGPEAWTDWKGVLLERLYSKTREVITKGEFSKEKTQERIARVKQTLIQEIGDRYSREDFQYFLSLMPPRYYFVVADTQIENHFLLHKQAEKEDFIATWELIENQSMNELTLFTPNAPQVFALVTGVLLYYFVNIIQADVFQTTDGHLLLILRVNDAHGKGISDTALFPKIKETLRQVLFGRSRMDDLLSSRQVPDYLMQKPIQQAQTKVVVDNEISAYNTVIDVYTHDRLGLLYDITRTLNSQGCYVEVSKISTKVDQVSDAFYVKDIFGHKILAPDKIRSIKKALEEIILQQKA